MIYYEVTKEGKIVSHDGEPDCWMDDDTEWEATDISLGDYVYYDGQGLYDPTKGIAFIDGKRVPVPAIITGSNGEATAAPSHSVDDLQVLIKT